MMSNDGLGLLLACLAGTVLGIIFFGGLWWTVRTFVSSAHSALYVLGSLLLRVGITVAGFHVISGGQWQRLLACMTGFLLVRTLALRLSRSPLGKEPGGAHQSR